MANGNNNPDDPENKNIFITIEHEEDLMNRSYSVKEEDFNEGVSPSSSMAENEQNKNQTKTLKYDPIVSSLLDELQDARNFSSAQCPWCSKDTSPFNDASSSSTNLIQRSFKTINDLDKALAETFIRYNRKLYWSRILKRSCQLNADLSEILKGQINFWERSFRDNMIQSALSLVQAAIREVRSGLEQTNNRTTRLVDCLFKNDLKQFYDTIELFLVEIKTQLNRIEQDCELIGGKLRDFQHLSVKVNQIMSNVRYQTDDVPPQFDPSWTESHMKQLNQVRSDVFENGKDEYFRKWFDGSRVKYVLEKIGEDFKALIERDDNQPQPLKDARL